MLKIKHFFCISGNKTFPFSYFTSQTAHISQSSQCQYLDRKKKIYKLSQKFLAFHVLIVKIRTCTQVHHNIVIGINLNLIVDFFFNFTRVELIYFDLWTPNKNTNLKTKQKNRYYTVYLKIQAFLAKKKNCCTCRNLFFNLVCTAKMNITICKQQLIEYNKLKKKMCIRYI